MPLGVGSRQVCCVSFREGSVWPSLLLLGGEASGEPEDEIGEDGRSTGRSRKHGDSTDTASPSRRTPRCSPLWQKGLSEPPTIDGEHGLCSSWSLRPPQPCDWGYRNCAPGRPLPNLNHTMDEPCVPWTNSRVHTTRTSSNWEKEAQSQSSFMAFPIPTFLFPGFLTSLLGHRIWGYLLLDTAQSNTTDPEAQIVSAMLFRAQP